MLGNLGELLAKEEELKYVSGNEETGTTRRRGGSEIKLRGKKFQVNFTN